MGQKNGTGCDIFSKEIIVALGWNSHVILVHISFLKYVEEFSSPNSRCYGNRKNIHDNHKQKKKFLCSFHTTKHNKYLLKKLGPRHKVNKVKNQ